MAEWSCPLCTFSNPGRRLTCEMCAGAAPLPPWSCSVCTLQNPRSAVSCFACAAPNQAAPPAKAIAPGQIANLPVVQSRPSGSWGGAQQPQASTRPQSAAAPTGVHIRCVTCQKVLALAPTTAPGSVVACPHCRASMKVPNTGPTTTAAIPPAAQQRSRTSSASSQKDKGRNSRSTRAASAASPTPAQCLNPSVAAAANNQSPEEFEFSYKTFMAVSFNQFARLRNTLSESAKMKHKVPYIQVEEFKTWQQSVAEQLVKFRSVLGAGAVKLPDSSPVLADMHKVEQMFAKLHLSNKFLDKVSMAAPSKEEKEEVERRDQAKKEWMSNRQSVSVVAVSKPVATDAFYANTTTPVRTAPKTTAHSHGGGYNPPPSVTPSVKTPIPAPSSISSQPQQPHTQIQKQPQSQLPTQTQKQTQVQQQPPLQTPTQPTAESSPATQPPFVLKSDCPPLSAELFQGKWQGSEASHVSCTLQLNPATLPGSETLEKRYLSVQLRPFASGVVGSTMKLYSFGEGDGYFLLESIVDITTGLASFSARAEKGDKQANVEFLKYVSSALQDLV